VTLHFEVRAAARGALARAEADRLRRRARRMLAAAGMAEGWPAVEAGLILTGDDEIHALNRAWRRKDRPTDVLAFAQRESRGGPARGRQLRWDGLLGDVVISVDTARRQRPRSRSLADEIAFLWSHGLCHLLGYDHRTDAEEARMDARMRALRDEGERRSRIRRA
jgi:probable rRNA maturation factor